MKIKLSIFLLLSTIGVFAQDTTKVYSVRIARNADGKSIMYSPKDQQLKKEGTFKLISFNGKMVFSLNKNFYLDGVLTSSKSKYDSRKAVYVNGTEVSSVEENREAIITKKLEVSKIDTNYFITKTEIKKTAYSSDTTIEKYKNRKPILKEKRSDGKLLFSNDLVKKIVFVYDKYGKLTEKHHDNVEEKYNSAGEIYFKRVFVKDGGGIEEYKNGKLSQTFKWAKDPNTKEEEKITITNYDESGKITKVEKTAPFGMVADEFLIFNLDKEEFSSYKGFADNNKR